MTAKRLLTTGLMLFLSVMGTAGTAYAEFNTDVRVKLGNAAGIDTVDISGQPTGNASQDGGGNFQVEVVVSPMQQAGVAWVVGGGIFGRTHKGNLNDLFFPPTTVEYDAWGLSGTGGVVIKANESLHFEGRLELDLGAGKPTLNSPVVVWNDVDWGGYAALDLLVGGYLTLGKPGLQIGLELGVQTFTGEFQILDNFGFWNDGTVRGSGGIANLVVGYRF